jgi:hypothetical protein
MASFYASEELLELEVICLKQRVESRDFKEAAKVAERISKICKRLKTEYDYSCSLGDYDRIMNTLARVDYGVGGVMPEVVW